MPQTSCSSQKSFSMLASKTLNPSSMETLSGIPSFTHRRSHLDSATYRTISRIFSVCHELSQKHQNPNPHVNISSVADECRTSEPAKFENPKLDWEIESSQLVAKKIDSVEYQNRNPGSTISLEADQNQTSDPGKLKNLKLDKTVEALQLLSGVSDSLKSQSTNPDAILCSVADKGQTNDPDKMFDNPQLDETVEALQLATNKINSMGSQKPNPNGYQISNPRNMENLNLDETVEALQLTVENIDSMDEVETDVSNNSERLNSMVSDLSLLVSGPVDHIQTGSHNFAFDGQVRDEKDHNGMLVGELHHEKDQNHQIKVDNSLTDQMEAANDAVLTSSCQEMALDKDIVETEEQGRLNNASYKETMQAKLLRHKTSLLETLEGIQLEDEISNLLISNRVQLNDLTEEGEITDDAQVLEDESDSDDKVEPLIDDETEKNMIDIRSDEKLATGEGMLGLEHEKVATLNQGIDPSEAVAKKRKRSTTSQRKANKKRSDRIKRAKKLIEAGVKRLRLPPPVKKEKEKKICKFYLQGKCQQGGQCKFSHDVIPVTKSKACNHFARGECLKGDECPYDHELSKYPCHKFVSEGMCTRGPNCKFSHNIQSIEGLSVQTKEAGNELPEKSNTGKQSNRSQKSSLAKSTPADINKHHNTSSFMSIEAPLKVPKGVRFLSFGADTKQEQHSDTKPITKEKSHLKEKNVVNVSEVGGNSGSGELSEASKILQEFLFGALSSTI